MNVLQRVRLNFLSFHLQESTDCSYDSIKIYDGKDTNASMVRTVCGTTVPEDITSSTHTLFVHFSSGDTSTYSAFQIYYSDFVDPGGEIPWNVSVIFTHWQLVRQCTRSKLLRVDKVSVYQVDTRVNEQYQVEENTPLQVLVLLPSEKKKWCSTMCMFLSFVFL